MSGTDRSWPAKALMWLRFNLAMLSFLGGIIVGVGGWALRSIDNFAEARSHAALLAENLRRVSEEVEGNKADRKGLLNDMVSVDQRINEANAAAIRQSGGDQRALDQTTNDLRSQLKDLDTRIQLLEQQARWTATRVPVPQVFGNRK